MKKQGDSTIIGIDHGYGYIKSANSIIKSGIEAVPFRPPFGEDILEVSQRVYVAGQIRGEQMTDKTVTDDYYNLTLVGMAKELKYHKLHSAKNVMLSVGLPYSFFSEQKEDFRKYLLKNKILNFSYEGQKYHVEIKDVFVYLQGLPVMAQEVVKYQNKTVTVADIGSRTIDVITFRRGNPFYDLCFSIDKKGTLDWSGSISKYYLQKYQEDIDEEDIQCIFQKEKTSLEERKVQFVKDQIRYHVREVMKLLESRTGSNSLILCGGGATVVKNYYGNAGRQLTIIDDIYCNARGYEMLTLNRLKK